MTDLADAGAGGIYEAGCHVGEIDRFYSSTATIAGVNVEGFVNHHLVGCAV